MNVREGMRRLGLVLGVLGASAGAFVAYDQLPPLLVRRAQYRTFQSLVTSRIVQQEVESSKKKAFGPPTAEPAPKASRGQYRMVPDFDVFAALCGEVSGWKVASGLIVGDPVEVLRPRRPDDHPQARQQGTQDEDREKDAPAVTQGMPLFASRLFRRGSPPKCPPVAGFASLA